MKKFFIFALSNGVNAAYGDNDNLGLFDIIINLLNCYQDIAKKKYLRIKCPNNKKIAEQPKNQLVKMVFY